MNKYYNQGNKTGDYKDKIKVVIEQIGRASSITV